MLFRPGLMRELDAADCLKDSRLAGSWIGSTSTAAGNAARKLRSRGLRRRSIHITDYQLMPKQIAFLHPPNLPVISEAERQFEDTFWSDFEEAAPRILSALLDAVSAALGRVNAVELLSRPRMADFARWVTAAEPALGWPDGAFMAAYDANREAVGDAAIDGNAVATAILYLAADGTPWRGAPHATISPRRCRND